MYPTSEQAEINYSETELEVQRPLMTHGTVFIGGTVTVMQDLADFSVAQPDQKPLVLPRGHPSETTLDDLGLREQFVIAVLAVKHSMNVCATEVFLMLKGQKASPS